MTITDPEQIPPSNSERRIDVVAALKTLDDSLHTHLKDYKSHEELEQTHYKELTNLLNTNIENTSELLSAWNSLQGTIKVLRVIGEVFKWCTGVAAGIGLIWAYLNNKFPN